MSELELLQSKIVQIEASVFEWKSRQQAYTSHLCKLLDEANIKYPSFETFHNHQHTPSVNVKNEPDSPIPPSPTEPAPIPPTSITSQKLSESWELIPKLPNPIVLSTYYSMEFPSIVCCAAISNDDTYLAVGYREGCAIINLTTGNFQTHSLASQFSGFFVRSLAFSGDGNSLIVAVEEHPLSLLDLSSSQVRPLYHLDSPEWKDCETLGVVTSDDGKFTASTDKLIRLWDEKFNLVATFGAQQVYTCIAVSSDSKYLAAGTNSGEVFVIDLEQMVIRTVLKGHEHAVLGVCFCQNSSFLASSSLDKTTRIWNNDFASVAVLEGHDDFVLANSFSNCGKWLFTGSKDQNIIIWRTDDWKIDSILKCHSNSIIGIVASQKSSMFTSVSGDKTLKLHSFKKPEN
ncbi:hypothetical protein P9112_004793 [Eukaryota sp. TZLM1-RC]